MLCLEKTYTEKSLEFVKIYIKHIFLLVGKDSFVI